MKSSVRFRFVVNLFTPTVNRPDWRNMTTRAEAITYKLVYEISKPFSVRCRDDYSAHLRHSDAPWSTLSLSIKLRASPSVRAMAPQPDMIFPS